MGPVPIVPPWVLSEDALYSFATDEILRFVRARNGYSAGPPFMYGGGDTGLKTVGRRSSTDT